MVSIANDLTMVDLMFGLYSKSSEKKKIREIYEKVKSKF